jgi:hypothetical protein
VIGALQRMDVMSLLGWLSRPTNKQAVSPSWLDTGLPMDYHEGAELATSVIKFRMSRALEAKGVPRADADEIITDYVMKYLEKKLLE